MRLCNICFRLFAQQTTCIACQQQQWTKTTSSVASMAISVSRYSTIPFVRALRLSQFRRFQRSLSNPCIASPGPQAPLFQKYASSRFGNLSSACFYSTEGPEKQSEAQKSPLSWKSLVGVAVAGGALLFGMSTLKTQREKEWNKQKEVKSVGKALLGGDWELTDHHGVKRSSTEFRGQWILIYFGFTHCPDICPEEVEKIVDVITNCDADENIPRILPIMITVDPERDNPAALKEYLAEFSPRMLGFTGTVEEVTQTTRTFRVYYSMGPKDDDGDYIVDHSIISYLVNPKGEFVDYFGRNKTADVVFKEMKAHIEKYQKNEGK